MSKRFRAALAALVCLGAAAASGAAQSQMPAGTLPPDCDRACLYGYLDKYLDALVHHDPARLPWAPGARYTENNVELAIGDGAWATVTKLGDYKLKFADTHTGNVGFFGVLTETNETSGFALRLAVVDRKITEAETLIVRVNDFGALTGGVNPFATGKFYTKPILEENVPPAQRRPRERMISIADGYFDTLQLNDGQLFTQFDPACNRVENGLQTTNNPDKPLGPVTALGCAEQFELGNYRYDDRLRARRFPLVDEERGLVLGMGFIDHSGRLGTYRLTDGRTVESVIRRPHSFALMELFKIVDGKIRQIEAVFITVPYNMPSPWVQ
ncbi:MAG TPA: hypothetical protein VG994_12980 [Steroidobacteraceae bacterium]|nr:hypothetical protein [Steroidobacteraceae bacterium]